MTFLLAAEIAPAAAPAAEATTTEPVVRPAPAPVTAVADKGRFRPTSDDVAKEEESETTFCCSCRFLSWLSVGALLPVAGGSQADSQRSHTSSDQARAGWLAG